MSEPAKHATIPIVNTHSYWKYGTNFKYFAVVQAKEKLQDAIKQISDKNAR
jgi:shikimate 5-dehydrogenase